jgi:tetratricopeptide (TPR) repeat protein
VGDEDEYAFRHVLVRDVAYSQIPRGDRAERHERAAAWIETLGRPEDNAEMLAHHYLEALGLRRAAGQDPSAALLEEARLAARDAGDRALALGSFIAASRFYEAALDLWPSDDAGRFELLLAYARSRVDDDALDDWVLEEAAEGFLRAGNIEAAAEAESRFGGIWINRGDRDKALDHLERGRMLLERRGPSPAKAFVLQELARVLMMGDDDRAIALATESLRLAEELGLDACRSRNLNTIGCGKVKSGDRSGIDDLERAVEIGEAANSHEEVSALSNLQTMVGLLGDLRRAAGLQERALTAARRQGVAGFIRWQEAEGAIYAYFRGEWSEAFAQAEAFIEAAEAGSPHYMDPVCRFIRGAIRLARGDTEAALGDARRATELARAIKDPQALNPAIAFEGRAELAAGNLDAANALADELLAVWGEDGVKPQLEAVDGVWLLTDLGRTDELEGAIGRAAQTLWHDAARRIASGDAAGAAEIYAEIGSVPDKAYARLRAGTEVQLRLALPVFAQLGATAWHAEAESLLSKSA